MLNVVAVFDGVDRQVSVYIQTSNILLHRRNRRKLVMLLLSGVEYGMPVYGRPVFNRRVSYSGSFLESVLVLPFISDLLHLVALRWQTFIPLSDDRQGYCFGSF
jgi:hypothetical protein